MSEINNTSANIFLMRAVRENFYWSKIFFLSLTENQQIMPYSFSSINQSQSMLQLTMDNFILSGSNQGKTSPHNLTLSYCYQA